MAKRSGKKASKPSKTGVAGSGGGGNRPLARPSWGALQDNQDTYPPGFAYAGIRVCKVLLLY